MLQQKRPDDYVISTNRQYTIKDFINKTAKILNFKIKWVGKGINERAYDDRGNIVISCDKNYFRPLEVENLLGNSSKAKKILKWTPKIKIDALIKDMVSYEMLNIKNNNNDKKK
jgi:GDPmannose 4,6-dehydratase